MINHSICTALSEEMIDEILADSFPASDPPPWTGGRETQCSHFSDHLDLSNMNSDSQLPDFKLSIDHFKNATRQSRQFEQREHSRSRNDYY